VPEYVPLSVARGHVNVVVVVVVVVAVVIVVVVVGLGVVVVVVVVVDGFVVVMVVVVVLLVRQVYLLSVFRRICATTGMRLARLTLGVSIQEHMVETTLAGCCWHFDHAED
jgi:hypothetical protein